VIGLDPHTRLSVQRLRILQQKKEAQAKATRRDIATLLERGKVETARVKVEASTHHFISQIPPVRHSCWSDASYPRGYPCGTVGTARIILRTFARKVRFT